MLSELKKLQFEFSDAFYWLQAWCKDNFIKIQYGELYRSPEEAFRLWEKGVGAKASAHSNRLAVDLIFHRLTLDEKQIILCERGSYEAAAKYWKDQHPAARWGGDFKTKKYDDIFHFSFEYKGIK